MAQRWWRLSPSVPGGRAGLPVYDRYAPALQCSYCRSLLGEPADADDAVQDTFIIAAAELDGLPDPGSLRPGSMPSPETNAVHRLRSCGPGRPAGRGGTS